MSIAILSEVENSQTENDKYYDLILFVSELSPKNEFSFQYADGFVSFENLSHDCIKFFLNRFKNFDIFPSNLSCLKGNGYKFHFHVDAIYDKFNAKIKVELPINKCSIRTLEILNCMQFLIDIFRGLHFTIVVQGDEIELCDLDQQSMQNFVDKMREIQLRPKKINFSSKFLFQLVFFIDHLVKFIEDECKLLELFDSKLMRDPSKICESTLSTDEFPTSIESGNGERSKFPINLKQTIPTKQPSSVPLKRGRKKRSALDKYALSNIDNDSLRSDVKTMGSPNKKVTYRRREVDTSLAKRSERLKKKSVTPSPVSQRKTRRKRLAAELTQMSSVRVVLSKDLGTDIDSHGTAIMTDSLDSTFRSVLRGLAAAGKSGECSYEDLVHDVTVKQEEMPAPSAEGSLRLIFSSCPVSSGLIYNSRGSPLDQNDINIPNSLDKRKKKKNVLI